MSFYQALQCNTISMNNGMSLLMQRFLLVLSNITSWLKSKATKAITTLDGLHPEKSNNYEIGTKYLGNGLNAEFTVFYLDFDKELLLERPDNIGTGIWTNLGATSHKGVELGLSYDFGNLYDSLQGLKVLQ